MAVDAVHMAPPCGCYEWPNGGQLVTTESGVSRPYSAPGTFNNSVPADVFTVSTSHGSDIAVRDTLAWQSVARACIRALGCGLQRLHKILMHCDSTAPRPLLASETHVASTLVYSPAQSSNQTSRIPITVISSESSCLTGCLGDINECSVLQFSRLLPCFRRSVFRLMLRSCNTRSLVVAVEA